MNQRLRGRVRGLEQDNADLRSRLAYAWQEVEVLRAQMGKRALQAAEPMERKYRTLVPVMAAELDAVLARLRSVRPLPLGSSRC